MKSILAWNKDIQKNIKNVLVVDDVRINRVIFKEILLKSLDGVNVIEATDGFKALEIVNTSKVDAVILDIMMPEMDGLQVLTEIKKNPITKNLPVIMCSAIHEIESIEKALRLGALDYFTKPLSEEQIKITLPLKVKNALEYYENKTELVRFYDHFKEELQFAQEIQEALISEHMDFSVAEIFGKYIPCEEVGGDIFCSKMVDDTLWFMIADISGHGIAAAMVSAMLKAIFNTTVELCIQPDILLKKINSVLFEVFGSSSYSLISAFAGYISGDSVCYVNAGHPYPAFYESQNNEIRLLESNGFLLGIFNDCDFTVVTEEIHTNDVILLYTDGLFDKGNGGGFADWNKINEYCDANKQKLSEDKALFLDEMTNVFFEAGARSFIDDVAIMLIRKK